MRKPEFNRADAADIVSTLLDRIATAPSASTPVGTLPQQQRQLSIVEFTEELLKQVAHRRGGRG